MKAADPSDDHEGPGADPQALVAGPLAVPALGVLAVGLLRRRPLLVIIGAVLLGLALKLVERDKLISRSA